MRSFEAILFWSMALVSGAALALCLLLPPWIEYQAELQRRQIADAQLAVIEQRLASARRQIDHLRDDPAYVLRLARQEFGQAVDTPGTETMWIDADPSTDAPPPPATTAPASERDVLPELSAVLSEMTQRYPHVSLFVSDATRPGVMLMATILLLTAVVLLGRPRRAAVERDAASNELFAG